eukprot:625879-Amphidinium_carterae.1
MLANAKSSKTISKFGIGLKPNHNFSFCGDPCHTNLDYPDSSFVICCKFRYLDQKIDWPSLEVLVNE